jgi:hypothetical protein
MARAGLITTLLIVSLAAPALAIVVTPTQPVFHTGDRIEFSVLNDGISTIHFPSSAPFVLHNFNTGEVFSFIGLTVIIDLDPGNTTTFGVSSETLTPGTYEIILNYYDDVWDRFTVSTATFILEVLADVSADSMGQLKSRFQE